MLGTQTFRGLGSNGVRLAGRVSKIHPRWHPRRRKSIAGRLLLIIGVCLGAMTIIGIIWHVMSRDLPQSDE